MDLQSARAIRIEELLAEPPIEPDGSGRLRATLRAIGSLWQLEVTRAGHHRSTCVLNGVTTASVPTRIHRAAERALARRHATQIQASTWRQVGPAWTAEITETPR